VSVDRVHDVELYAVFLGGELAEGRMGEDHEVVFVVGSDDLDDVRRRARRKWTGHGRAHVDAVRRLDVVDGFAVSVADAGGAGDRGVLDTTYVPGEPTG
jgi:hypothetical protein